MRLRWEICKALGKTLDDPIFDTLSPLQWMTYAALLRQDREEEVEKVRDFIEYGARFWDSKAVDQIQEARKHSKKTDDSAFERVLKQKFGRGLKDVVPPQLTIDQLGAQIQQAAKQQKGY